MATNTIKLILYGRENCCLCDRLHDMILAIDDNHRITLEKRMINQQEAWLMLYGPRIPVLCLGAKVLLEGRPDQAKVTTTLEQLIQSYD